MMNYLELELFNLVHVFFGISPRGIVFEIFTLELRLVKCEGDAK